MSLMRWYTREEIKERLFDKRHTRLSASAPYSFIYITNQNDEIVLSLSKAVDCIEDRDQRIAELESKLDFAKHTIDIYEAENERLEREVANYPIEMGKMAGLYQERVATLTEALRWYADARYDIDYLNDSGKRARAALAKAGAE